MLDFCLVLSYKTAGFMRALPKAARTLQDVGVDVVALVDIVDFLFEALCGSESRRSQAPLCGVRKRRLGL